MRKSVGAYVRARGHGRVVAPPPTPVDVRAPEPRSTSGVIVKRHGRVVKGAATGRALVDGWGLHFVRGFSARKSLVSVASVRRKV